MLIKIKNIEVYTPEVIGVQDVFISAHKIVGMTTPSTAFENEPTVTVIKGDGYLITPGLIDNHVHLIGGGGEGGYRTRTPELMISDLWKSGITTVVGCLGTDGVTRQMESLVAKAYGLREEGASVYLYTGSYRIPLVTVTGDVQKDLLMVEPIIGVGEIAVSDHRSSSPSILDLSKCFSDARVGGLLSGKAGVVNIHMGDSPEGLKPVEEALTYGNIPITQVLPTHTNRNETLLNQAIHFAKKGGFIDFTASSLTPSNDLDAPKAFMNAIKQGVSSNHITFSSDGQGSLPVFDEYGNIVRLEVGCVSTLWCALRYLVTELKCPIELALKPVTQNPARILKLPLKGTIAIGNDADLLMVRKDDFSLYKVFSKGQCVYEDGKFVAKGTFER